MKMTSKYEKWNISATTGWILLKYETEAIGIKLVGPSGVRALHLAAGINVGGHYKWHFLSLSPPGSLLILTEGDVVGFCNFAWAPK